MVKFINVRINSVITTNNEEEADFAMVNIHDISYIAQNRHDPQRADICFKNGSLLETME